MQVSNSAPGSISEEIAEMSQKLERSEKDLDLMNKQVEQSQGKRPMRCVFSLKFDFEQG
jgi:hypothetical protein